TVNGEPIMFAEIDAILKVRPKLRSGSTEADQRELQHEVLNILIDDVVVAQYLRKHTPAPPPAEVSKKLRELQAALKDQGETFEDYCRDNGQTEAQVRANIVCLLQRGAFVANQVNDAAVRKYYEEYRDFFDRVTVRTSHILLRLSPSATPV